MRRETLRATYAGLSDFESYTYRLHFPDSPSFPTCLLILNKHKFSRARHADRIPSGSTVDARFPRRLLFAFGFLAGYQAVEHA